MLSLVFLKYLLMFSLHLLALWFVKPWEAIPANNSCKSDPLGPDSWNLDSKLLRKWIRACTSGLGHLFLLGLERSLSVQAAWWSSWVSLPCVGTGASRSFKSWSVIICDSIMKLFCVLSKRTYREPYRDYFDNLWFFQATGVAILLGLLWWKSKIETEAQVRDQVRSWYFIVLFLLILSHTELKWTK